MKKQKYKPYFFNYKYERRTYKYIGRDYGDSITANKGCIRNFTRWFRKHIYNRKESKYKICDTYEEWECYVKNKLPMRKDYKNYLHWLIDKRRLAESELEIVMAILIPIYIAFLSMKEFFNLEEISSLWDMLMAIMVISIISACILYVAKENLDFWNDWIAIVNSVM